MNKIIIKFVISRHRKHFKPRPKPKKMSKYAKQLWQIGAGWKDE